MWNYFKFAFVVFSVIKNFNTIAFNHAIHHVLKSTEYPVGQLEQFPLLDNEDILVIDDIYQTLEDSGVGIPAYYLPVDYTVEIDGKEEKGTYSRSRSGCFFCFFQQKIEWVWLLEQHPELCHREAMARRERRAVSLVINEGDGH